MYCEIFNQLRGVRRSCDGGVLLGENPLETSGPERIDLRLCDDIKSTLQIQLLDYCTCVLLRGGEMFLHSFCISLIWPTSTRTEIKIPLVLYQVTLYSSEVFMNQKDNIHNHVLVTLRV